MTTWKKTPLAGPVDLDATLHSGQAFRWRRRPDGAHAGFIQNEPVQVRVRKGRLEWDSAAPLSADAISHYFRLDPAHEEFLATIPSDPFLQTAVRAFPGLRLLRQDPWETLVSFLLSQNSNEPKIKGTIEGICRLAGAPVRFRGEALFRFPSPADLAGLDEAALRTTGMGYRVPYVRQVAGAVADGRLDPATLPGLPYEDAFGELMKLPGIGAKVADCILLYGCDHRAAFPTDVWVRRLLRETYLRRPALPSHERIQAFARRRFGPQPGYAQHYLFHYRRAVGVLSANPEKNRDRTA